MGKNWDSSERWYTSCVGEKGHYYHQAVVLPNSLRLLYRDNLKNREFGQEGPQNSHSERETIAERQGSSENANSEVNPTPPKTDSSGYFGTGKKGALLDLGCGQGVLARHLPEDVDYCGIDQSKALVESAKRLTKDRKFLVADVTKSLPIEKVDYDRAAFILSLQNMEDGNGAIQNASKHLKIGGKLLIVLNHPCFRIPRQSSWGIDEQMKMQYRRMNSYLSPQKIPIQTNPGKGEKSETTFSYHHPLSDYVAWLQGGKMSIVAMEEWISDKKSEGAKAKMEDRARKEFPLFLAILAIKEA